MNGPIIATGNSLANSGVVIRANEPVAFQSAFGAADDSDSSFPVENLFCRRSSKVWKAASDGTMWALDIDFTVAVDLNFVALINYENISIWSIYTSTTGLVDEWTEQINEADPNDINSYGTWTKTTARYLRLGMMTNPGGATPKIGELILDEYVQLSRSFIWGASISRNWNSVVHETTASNHWSIDYGTDIKSFGLTWRGLTESEKDEIDDLLEQTKGAVYPFVAALFTEDGTKQKEVYYLKGPSGYSYTDIHTASKEVAGLEFVEMPRDIEI